jgi:NHL repeat
LVHLERNSPGNGSGNSRLRALTNIARTVAGGFVGDGSPATRASLVLPENIAFDAAGNYYIADFGGNRVRKVSAGTITTVAGTGISGYSGDGGAATSAELYFPAGVAVDGTGNIYIADAGNGVIRKVSAGTINTFATGPNFSDLTSLAVDSAGNLYSADDGACVVRKITPGGVVTVVAGMEFNCGYNADGIRATNALLNAPFGVAVDSKGNLYIGDTANNRVRLVNANGVIFTIAGDGNCGFSGDGGPSTSAELCNPTGVGLDSTGNVYIADEVNLRVRRISGGTITTLAGSGLPGFNGDGLPATGTNLDCPVAVAAGPRGAVFLVDNATMRVRRIR